MVTAEKDGFAGITYCTSSFNVVLEPRINFTLVDDKVLN